MCVVCYSVCACRVVFVGLLFVCLFVFGIWGCKFVIDDFRILEFQNFGNWNFRILGYWYFAVLGFWDLEFGSCGILEFQNFGISDFWNFRILEFRDFGNWNFRILEYWNFAVLEYWDLEFGNCVSCVCYGVCACRVVFVGLLLFVCLFVFEVCVVNV